MVLAPDAARHHRSWSVPRQLDRLDQRRKRWQSGDKSWQQKHAEALAAKDTELGNMRGTLNKLLVDNVAVSMANECVADL